MSARVRQIGCHFGSRGTWDCLLRSNFMKSPAACQPDHGTGLRSTANDATGIPCSKIAFLKFLCRWNVAGFREQLHGIRPFRRNHR
jgi:hypothetical protein